MFPRSFVYFGILHCIALASVLAWPLVRRPLVAAVVGATVIVAGLTFSNTLFDQRALSWLGFTTQKPATVFVAVRKQTAPLTIEGAEIRFVSVEARKFFGFKTYNVYGRSTRISDPEKTLVDCIDRPDLAGGPSELTRIVHAAMAEIDQEKLMIAALQMNSKALLQRLGFLSDLVERPLKDEPRQQLRAAIPKKTRSTFGARARREGDIGYVAEWELHVHARKDELLSEVPRIRKKDRTNADDRANP